MSRPQGVSRGVPEHLPDSIAIVVDAAEALKATDLLVLDLRDLASFTDYMAMCTGSSDRHVQAVVDGIREKLKEAGVTPLHTEGYDQATWVLVDFVDFLVNVFTPEARDFYQLDRVWRDAPVVVGERPAAPARDDASTAEVDAEGTPADPPDG